MREKISLFIILSEFFLLKFLYFILNFISFGMFGKNFDKNPLKANEVYINKYTEKGKNQIASIFIRAVLLLHTKMCCEYVNFSIYT